MGTITSTDKRRTDVGIKLVKVIAYKKVEGHLRLSITAATQHDPVSYGVEATASTKD